MLRWEGSARESDHGGGGMTICPVQLTAPGFKDPGERGPGLALVGPVIVAWRSRW